MAPHVPNAISTSLVYFNHVGLSQTSSVSASLPITTFSDGMDSRTVFQEMQRTARASSTSQQGTRQRCHSKSRERQRSRSKRRRSRASLSESRELGRSRSHCANDRSSSNMSLDPLHNLQRSALMGANSAHERAQRSSASRTSIPSVALGSLVLGTEATWTGASGNLGSVATTVTNSSSRALTNLAAYFLSIS